MKVFKIAFMIGLAALVTVACSEKSPSTTGQAEPAKTDVPAQVASQAAPPAPAQETVSQAAEEAAPQTAQQTTTEAVSEMADSVASAPSEIDGTLMQTEKGVAIVTADNAYLLSDKALSSMVGKRVKITGTLADTEAGKVLQVMSVTPVE
ncbi:exported hypothetical protein [Desulfosarcina cetonica]|uniref:hypothetical protein n=1 Tax=Desulfosarcina cetonica TaxID=90730 RepID=UPI0006D10FD1|nr:hypothetical protein [Desulfosarcina cetonica]VTR71174.1 exported hypothetical protein [Desulfosarcina cetonica]